MSRIVPELRRLVLLAVGGLALLAASAQAELTIEITGAGSNRIPVAIADFGGEASASRTVTAVIRSDLERSGLIKLIDPAGVAMTEASAPAYDE